MPRATTLEEKRERALSKLIPTAPTPTPAVDGKTRRKRNVFNGTQTKISVNQQIPGYHLHVFTDVGNRVQDAQDSGYEFVNPEEVGGVSDNVVSRNGDLGDRVRYLVNPRAEGSEQYGYLMKQRLEWYEEDQEALQQKNNAIDAAIRKGKLTAVEGGYTRPGDIKMT